MFYKKLEDIQIKELIPGSKVRFLHSENMTLAYWNFEPGVNIPEHSHPHEQVCNIINGEFELDINGNKKYIKPGDIAIIPPNIKHSGKSISECYIIDVFYPIREDYK